jgi:hypothetical protein
MDTGLVGLLIGIVSAYLFFAALDIWMRLKSHRRGA